MKKSMFNKMQSRKKGISEIVSYVLLTSMALLMAGVIFSWLKFYAVKPFPTESCPEISIIIQDYNCIEPPFFNITIQNRGRFDIDGFIIKIHNGTALYSMIDKESNRNYIKAPSKMGPEGIINKKFDYSRYNHVNETEIEAIRGFDKAGRPVLCEDSVVRQKIEGC